MKNPKNAVTVRFSSDQFRELKRLAKQGERSLARQVLVMVKDALNVPQDAR